jgi:succinoglycan biosynthesis protein ExoO
MLSFHSDHGPVHPPPSLLLTSSSWAEEKNIRPAEFIRANSFNTASPPLGYLKPLFRRAFLKEFSLTYDPRLRIGEDYDLVARCLEAGARYLFLPAPTYFYRRHDTSTSHRLSIPDLESLVATSQEAISRDPDSDYGKALLERHDSLLAALAHQRTVELFKGGQPIRALRLACSSGRALRLLAASGIEGSTRRLRRLLRAPRRSSTAAAVPTALSLGVLRAGSPTARLERKLQTAGFDVIRQAQLEPVAVASSAISLPRLDLILAPSPEAAEAAAYTLSPQVPVLTEASNQARRYGYDMLVEPAGAGSTSIILSNSNARRKASIPQVGMDLADPEE